MGGTGSGNWYRWQGRKATVEESLTLAVGDFRDRLRPHAVGSFTWTRGGKVSASISYSVAESAGRLIVMLCYRWQNVEQIRVPVRLQATPTQFGGRRWWFTCPLIVNGVPCNRRVGKLYLPARARYFGCRRSHGLTYRSCQEAHQAERLFGRLGMELGFPSGVGRLLAQDFLGSQV